MQLSACTQYLVDGGGRYQVCRLQREVRQRCVGVGQGEGYVLLHLRHLQLLVQVVWLLQQLGLEGVLDVLQPLNLTVQLHKVLLHFQKFLLLKQKPLNNQG